MSIDNGCERVLASKECLKSLREYIKAFNEAGLTSGIVNWSAHQQQFKPDKNSEPVPAPGMEVSFSKANIGWMTFKFKATTGAVTMDTFARQSVSEYRNLSEEVSGVPVGSPEMACQLVKAFFEISN